MTDGTLCFTKMSWNFSFCSIFFAKRVFLDDLGFTSLAILGHLEHGLHEGLMVGKVTFVSMMQRRVLVEVVWTASNLNYRGERLLMNRKNSQVVDHCLR